MADPKDIYSWFLWKRHVTDYDTQFLHISDLPNLGFASVYAVDENTATTLQKTQDPTGFKGIVWSEKLWIDCDTPEASVLVEDGLRKLGLGFEKWSTGNRGAHFGVNRLTEPSQNLPLQDKVWVKTRFPQADLKLYSHLHLFRRAGNSHEKTGRKKEIEGIFEGGSIEHTTTRVHVSMGLSDTDGAEIDTSIFEDTFVTGWSTPQENGQRNRALSNVAYRMAERGESAEFTLRWLEHVNALFADRKPKSELEKIIRYAYANKK